MYINLLGNPLKVVATKKGYNKTIYLCEDYFGIYDWVIVGEKDEAIKIMSSFNEKDSLGFFLFYQNLYSLQDLAFQLTGKVYADVPNSIYSFLLKLGYIDKDKNILIGCEKGTYFSSYFFRLKIKFLRRLYNKDLEATTQKLGAL